MHIFYDFWDRWKSDWFDNRLLFWLDFVGTITSIAASILIMTLVLHPPMHLILPLWLIGSICLSTSFYIRRNGSAMVLMLWYTIANTLGILNLVIQS